MKKYTSYYILSFYLLFISCKSNDFENSLFDLDALSVKITSPTNTKTVFPYEPIEFRGKVTSTNNQSLNNLRVEWISDVDGILYNGTLNKEGMTSFVFNDLSKSIHYIKLNIYNKANEVIYDEIIVYNAIWIHSITDNNNHSFIKWSKAKDSDFESYQIFRAYYKNEISKKNEEKLIYTTNNISDTTYIDNEALLGTNHYYRAFIKRKTFSPNYIGSNIDSITLGKYIKLDYPIYKIINDPNRDYAYGIINTKSIYDNNSTGYGVVFINTKTKKIEKRILNNIKFSDLDIDFSGDFLYLCSQSSIIHKINLASKDLESTFSIGNSAHKIEIGSNNNLYFHITPPTSGGTRFGIYSLSQNISLPYKDNMPDAYEDFRHGDFELDNNNVIYHGESNSSGSSLTKLSTNENTFSIVNQWDLGDYSDDRLILNNNKLYWNHLVFDNNLNPLGSFFLNQEKIRIQTVSPDGKIALGFRRLFKTDDQTILKTIPVIYNLGTFVNNNYLLLANNQREDSYTNSCTLYFYEF